jgi:hypothetical protein
MTLPKCIVTWKQPLVPTLGPHCVDNLASDSQQLFPAFAFAWVCVCRQELLHLCRQCVHGRLVGILCGQPFAKRLVMSRQALCDIPPHSGQERVLRHCHRYLARCARTGRFAQCSPVPLSIGVCVFIGTFAWGMPIVCASISMSG